MNNEQDLEVKPLVTFAAPVVTATPAFAHIVPFLIWINLAEVKLRPPPIFHQRPDEPPPLERPTSNPRFLESERRLIT